MHIHPLYLADTLKFRVLANPSDCACACFTSDSLEAHKPNVLSRRTFRQYPFPDRRARSRSLTELCNKRTIRTRLKYKQYFSSSTVSTNWPFREVQNYKAIEKYNIKKKWLSIDYFCSIVAAVYNRKKVVFDAINYQIIMNVRKHFFSAVKLARE